MVGPHLSRRRRSIAVSAIVITIVLIGSWLGDRLTDTRAQQTVGQVTSVSAASFDPTGIVAPDSIVAAFGTNLATITQVANTLPLPTTISNVTVEVNGRPAALLFISPEQINYLLPDDLIEGTGQVLVKRNGQIVAAGEIEVRAGAPSVFMANADVQGPPAANLLRVLANGSRAEVAVAQFDGTKGRFVSRLIDLDGPGETVFLILYLTGTSKDPQAGDYRMLLGGSECRPEYMPYIGVAPGFAGLKQINLNLGGCVRKLREEDARATFTGKVSITLADIRNSQTSNRFELEFAPPTGAPPRVTGLNKATLLAGEVLEIQGSGLAETTEVYLTDSSGNRFNAQIEKPITPTNVKVRVPFGAGTGTVTAVTGRGESTFPLTMRTSVSGVVQLAQRQPDGTDRRIGLRNATVRVISPIVTPAVMTGDDGSFLIPDATIPNATQGTAIYLNVDASTAGVTDLSLKRVDRMIAFAGRDNQFPGYLELRPSTGKSITVGSNGLLSDEPIRMTASARPEENEYTGQTGEVVFEPNGSTVRFADGSTVSAVTVTALDTGRVPVDLPPGQFSSTIVQLTPFGGEITPGGKLTLPNTDGLPAGTAATLYRYVQLAGNAARGQWVAEGVAQVSADGVRVETRQNAVKEMTYYFVSVPRPLTLIYGSVKEADGQPARAAQVQVRGQSGFALTDDNGGFQLQRVPMVRGEMAIEVTYLRADGTVDRAERRGVQPIVGKTLISPPIVLPGQGQGRAPVLLLPKSLAIEAGKTVDYTFLAYTRVATAVLQPLAVTGAPFANITSQGNDRYILRLTPGVGAAGNYTLTVTATDNLGMRGEETIALIVSAPIVNAPTAVSQSVTTDEDQPVGITLTGSGGTQYRIVNPPQRGVLSGTPPTLIYTPNRDYSGSDSFSFAVRNGNVESTPATVTIAIRPIGESPRLEVGATFRTNIGQLLRIVINGFDPDTDQSLTLAANGLPIGASIRQTTATSFIFEWRATSGQIGNHTIGLTLSDNGVPVRSDSKTISIAVDAIWAPSLFLGKGSHEIHEWATLDGVIFAGTFGGGVYQSTDNGTTWAESNMGLPPGDGRNITAMTVDREAILVGTSGLGIYRSTDRGGTWRETNTGLPQGLGRYVLSLMSSGEGLLVGTLGSGVYRSTDNGATWVEANTGLPPGNSRKVSSFASNGEMIFAVTDASIVYRSADNGATWTEVNIGLSQVNSVISMAASGRRVFAGTFFGIYQSADNGATWTDSSTGLPLGNNASIVALTAIGGSIFAGTRGRGIYRSTDAGATWVEINTGLPLGSMGSILSFLFSGGRILVGTQYTGVYRSTNNGATWSEVNTGLPGGISLAVETITSSSAAQFAGLSLSGIFRSLDNGTSWAPVNNSLLPENGRFIRSLISIGTTVFAATSGFGIYRTIDNGTTWTESNVGLPTGNARSVTTLVANGGTMFAGTGGAGIYRSTNNGASWAEANVGLPAGAPRSTYSLAVGNGVIFAGTFSSGIYRSADNGATWVESNIGLTQANAKSIRSILVRDGLVFAGTDGAGVYRSADNGATWTQTNGGLPLLYGVNITSIASNGAVIFVGTYGAGIYRSADNGTTWVDANAGLPTGRARNVGALFESGGTFFAGTWEGVFTLSESAVFWEPRRAGLGDLGISAALLDQDALLVGTSGAGVFRSVNDGLSWAPTNTGLPIGARVQALLRTPIGTFVGLMGAGVYLSTDQGQTWFNRSSGLANLRVRALAGDQTKLWAGTEEGVFYSTDQGQTWAAYNTGLTDLRILSLSSGPDAVYAGTENGLFSLNNGSSSWTGINTGLGNLYITSISPTPDGGGLLVGTASGLYRSLNHGANWSPVTDGISDRVVALAFAVNGNRLLVGTISGFYTSDNNGASWRANSRGLLNIQVSALAVKGSQIFAGTRGGGVFISRLE